MAGVLDLMTIDRPNRNITQLGKGTQPIAISQLSFKAAIAGGRHLGDQRQAPRRFEGIKPSAARHRRSSGLVCQRLQKSPAGLVTFQRAGDTQADETLVDKKAATKSNLSESVNKENMGEIEERPRQNETEALDIDVTSRMSFRKVYYC